MNRHVLFNLILCIVTGINKNFFVVVSGYNSWLAEVCGDNACSVVIAFCIIYFCFFTTSEQMSTIFTT